MTTNLRNVVTDSSSMRFAAANHLNTPESDFPLGTAIADSDSSDNSRLFNSHENAGEVNNGTFIKVSKSGSFGRSLDISRFGSYPELCSELEHMFGLQGQLEDPLRSGWQLVFVDRENDTSRW